MVDPQADPEVLSALVRLMANLDNPSTLSEGELIEAAAEARATKKTADLTVATELASRGWSWRQVGAALGVDHSTAYGWVRDAGRLPQVEAARAERAQRGRSEA